MASTTQQKLIRIAQEHCFHAEARDEGDVAVFIDCTVNGQPVLDEIHVVGSMTELRDALGY